MRSARWAPGTAARVALLQGHRLPALVTTVAAWNKVIDLVGHASVAEDNELAADHADLDT
jgi:hypothetical protein